MNANQQPQFQQNQQPNFGAGTAQMQGAMAESDIMQDMLSSAKALADGYCIQTEETACPQLRQIMMENWSQTVNDQYTIFEAMRTRNWYQVKNAQPQEIQQAKQTFAQEKPQVQ